VKSPKLTPAIEKICSMSSPPFIVSNYIVNILMSNRWHVTPLTKLWNYISFTYSDIFHLCTGSASPHVNSISGNQVFLF